MRQTIGVIYFKMVGGSSLMHEVYEECVESFMIRCCQLVMDHDDPRDFRSNAYMIREMGDGFLCSVGYPFHQNGRLKSLAAVELAEKIVDEFELFVQALDAPIKIYSTIGIARGMVKSYFSKSGRIRDDLWGRVIILLFKLMILGGWLITWPCLAENASKIYEIGSQEQRLDIDEMRYFLEPDTVPLDIQKIIKQDSWSLAKIQRRFLRDEIDGKRVIFSFDISTVTETVFFNYMWAPPLKVQKFFIVDSQAVTVEAEEVRSTMFLARVKLLEGRYRVYFVAEPAALSDMKSNIFVMNSAFVGGSYLTESKFYLFVYGVGAAFVFFNFTMFLLHRKPYFIHYVCYSLTILYILMVGSGDLYPVTAVFWNLALSLNGLFTILMSASVLRLKEFHPRLLRNAYIVWIVSTVCMSSQSFFSSALVGYVGILVGLFCYFICMYAAVRRMMVGYMPATFFALGWGVLGTGYALNLAAIYLTNLRGLVYSAYVAYAVESMLFAVALAYRTRDSELKAIADKLHALSQLQKVVYPHQIERIKHGTELEQTMPTTPSHGCVLAFDIINSSKIKHIKAKEFFRNFFARCNKIMNEGYDGKNLKAKAYRIKEIGDGGLCSIGYPFASLTDNPANEAVDLAMRIAEALVEEAELLHSPIPIACGFGIALDTLSGFYPESGAKEYDIYGPALVLATRYEGMRKTLFQAESHRSVLIIQAVVYQSLDPSHRAGFLALDLKDKDIVVRDDPAATQLYYQFLDRPAAKREVYDQVV